MKRALALRHVHFEDLGILAPILEARDYAIRYADAGFDDFAEIDEAAVDLLVVLGGPIGAYEEDRYPFLTGELALIERRLKFGRPTLGLCLGAQLMARALGAEVRPGPAKEIGWAPVTLTEAGRLGPLRHLGTEAVMHWHGDMFALPAGADRLASTDLCPNQAFALGPAVLGIQFHPELAAESVERWLIGHAAELAATRLAPDVLRREAAVYGPGSAKRGRALFEEWLDCL